MEEAASASSSRPATTIPLPTAAPTANTNLASNPDSGTVGSPASYSASLAVASISGVKTPYFLLSDGTEIYFRESRLVGKTDENDFVAGMLGDAQEGTFDFVVVPGVGYEANYNGIDVNGKIAVVRRGGNTFEQKVAIAKNKGAKGIIIYNNVSGMLNMSVGTQETIPSCLISMDYGDILVEAGTGTISLSKDYLAGPFMSDFSSWGVLPNLTLSPDITAHGGEITSSYPGGNEYDTISGTSMACPNLAGALILVRQYVKDMDSSLTTSEIRDLSYSLLMSTATIANNEYGNPYSPRKQGAGLADIKKSVTTKAYLTVDGSNKPKLSLGDDPTVRACTRWCSTSPTSRAKRSAMTSTPVVFTESMSSDDRTVAELAYLLDADYSYSVVATEGNASLNGNNLSLGGYSSAKITITLTLSQEAKDYIDANFVNGMYVEGYVRLNSLNADGIGLNLPFLAFYGNWADAPMLDVTEYEVGASQEGLPPSSQRISSWRTSMRRFPWRALPRRIRTATTRSVRGASAPSAITWRRATRRPSPLSAMLRSPRPRTATTCCTPSLRVFCAVRSASKCRSRTA